MARLQTPNEGVLVDDLVKLGPGAKKGIRGRTKFFYQCVLGLSAGCLLYWYPPVVNLASSADPATTLSLPFFKDAGFSLGILYIPLVAVVLAGGYAINTDDTVQMHCNTYRELESVIGQ